MADHKATVRWKFQGGDFIAGKYSREHTIAFDGGMTVNASASPSVVPAPFSNPAHMDPEEAFVAALASCHMLSFLYVASRHKFAVESYEDDAIGTMGKNERGAFWVKKVSLRPRVTFAGKQPSREEHEHMHHEAHEACFIANSVKTDVVVEL
ncbi:OsmC family protein [Candidatus Sumerlaeota bacterium]|nr:OsmC family protein [Candidatus Sumerlaeota bacterium]